MRKFDEIVQKYYQKEFLLEFPGQTGMSTTEPYDFEYFNKKEAAELKKSKSTDSYKKTDSISNSSGISITKHT